MRSFILCVCALKAYTVTKCLHCLLHCLKSWQNHMRILDKMLTKIDYKKWKRKAKLSMYNRREKQIPRGNRRYSCGTWGWGWSSGTAREWESGAMVAHKALHTHAMSGTKGRFGFRSGAVQWKSQIVACAM